MLSFFDIFILYFFKNCPGRDMIARRFMHGRRKKKIEYDTVVYHYSTSHTKGRCVCFRCE
jgi:hypothetical protein